MTWPCSIHSKHQIQQACLPLVEVREGPGLVRDKGQVKRLAVVRDDAVGVVQPPADLLQKVRVVAVVVARAEQIEDLLGVGCGGGRRGVRDGHDGNVVLVGVQTCKRGRAWGVAESGFVCKV